MIRNKKKKCKVCKDEFIPYLSTQKVCNYNCAILLAKKEVSKKQKAKNKEQKEALINWKNKLQTKVQEIARLIDEGQLCLARQIECKQAHGGHILSKGGNSQMRFNLHNIHKQSAYSNTYKNDDGLMQEGIVRKYGEDYLKFIKGLVKYPIPNYNNMDYKMAYKRACSFSNELKRNLSVNTKEERISLRNQANEVIGIYNEEQNIFT